MSLAACGGASDPVGFEPGPAGRAVGLFAVVEGPDGTIESTEIEIVLAGQGQDSDDSVPMAPRAAQAGSTVHWHGRVATDTFVAAPTFAARHTLPVSAPAAPASACDAGLPTGTEVDEMGTLDGRICFFSSTFAIGSLGAEETAKFVLYFTPEGIYYGGESDANLYVPPDIAHGSWIGGVGCFIRPPGETMTSDYIESQRQLSIAAMLAGALGLGLSFYLNKEEGFARAIEFDTIIGATLNFPLLAFIPVSLAMQAKTLRYFKPRTLMAWDGSCVEPLSRGSDSGFRSGSDPMAMMRDRLQALAAAPQGDYQGAVRGHMADSLLPIAELLAAGEAEASADGMPAGSNGGWFRAFVARPGSERCDDCSSTSIDGIIADLADGLTDAEDGSAVFEATAKALVAGTQGMPEPMRQVALQTEVLAGVDLALEYAADVIAEREGAADRYVAQAVKVVTTTVGEPAALDVTAEEVSALTGIDEDALEGATVHYEAGPLVGEAAFAIEDGVSVARVTPERATKLVFRVSVDLSTAAGPLPMGAEDWVVQPALRVLEPEAGPPAMVYLGAPARIESGAPTHLSATVVDEYGSVVDTPLSVEFFDADVSLGRVETVDGTATIRVTPEPSAIVVDAIDPVTVTLVDDRKVPGVHVTGSGYSRQAIVRLDGEPLEALGEAMLVESSRSLVLTTESLEPGTHVLELENPDDPRVVSASLHVSP